MRLGRARLVASNVLSNRALARSCARAMTDQSMRVMIILYLGFVGQWKLIKEDSRFGPILVNRSNVDCKDKWRQTTTPVKTQRRAAPLSPPLQAIVSSPMHNDRTFQNAMNMPHSPMGSPRSPPSHTRGVLAELSPAPSPLRLIQQPTFEPLPSSPSSSEDGSPATRDEGGCTVM